MTVRRYVPRAGAALTLALVLATACAGGQGGGSKSDNSTFTRARAQMVETTIVARGVRDSLVLAAMRRVPRHRFVPESWASAAYADQPLPIGEDQTISQPYIVALMTELLRLRPGDKVLEIGTGSGYQAAVLAEITPQVYSIEILAPLAERAAATLHALGYDSVRVRAGDGYQGWPEAAPFDAIIVTAAPDHVPHPLKDQLAPGGRLVLPVGDELQELRRITRAQDGTFTDESVIPVRFVPMTGEASRR
ncbi:MAG TPA: protein-L-isoaspartate(D-aspartate) O-methyltransferase [Candidatus Udaeobacter sp.]|nr:protein-L-isoaspartate(D-aspartate) O-methyltransferase [Candidatus Udaeobacter sp.]